MPLDKPPLSDEPSYSEGLKATSPDPDWSTAEPTPQLFAWDKLHFLNGGPTQAFRDNLKPELKYVTAWNYGGMTNDVMVWMNIIHLGLFSNRNPILFPLAGGEDHVGLGPETLSAGKIFDLPRLSQAIQHSVPDWQDVKEGRFDLPWDRVDYNWHDDDELLGCWSIFQTFNAAKTPLDREMPHFLHLDVQYTAVPPTVKLAGTEGGHTDQWTGFTFSECNRCRRHKR